MHQDFHEPELKRHLAPVKAPDELWDRVHSGTIAYGKPGSAAMTWRWAAAAIAAIAVVAGATVWVNRPLSSEELAVRALNRGPEQMEFRSTNLAELRTWVKAGTGLDIPLMGRAAPSVRLIGASVIRKGSPAVEISYRVGDSGAALVISKAPPQRDGRHAFVKSGSYHGASFQSWTMRGQMYTVASVGASANARLGCMLCHSTGTPPASVN
jgi:hypothetical protein